MITIYNSNLDFDLDSSNSITLSSTSNMVFKTNGTDKMTIQNNGISVSGNVVVSGLITSTGAGFSGIGAGLSNIPISAINELRLELNGSTTDLSVTRDALTSRIVSEVGFGSNYTGRINSELNTRVDNTSNYVLATSNILIGRIINTSNYVDSTSNFLSVRIDNTSNYVLATSNILIGRIINTSNYVDSTSNFLSGRIDNTSNYVLATSNILIGRIINTSNYVDSTSNFLAGRIDNTSNYVAATSNILIGRIINASNYVESTSNTLIGRVINASNFVESTSNTLIGRIINTSNYVESTSNTLIGRVINASNYVDSTSNFLSGRIDNTSNYALATSNILIGRIINTSNYVDSTSNILIGRIINTSNYVESTSNTLIGRIINTSNYVDSTSNFLARRIDNASSWGSNYTDKADIWGSNYSDKVGGWGSNYAYDKVGVWSSNYAYDKVGVWGSNYSDRVGGWGSNYAYDKVGVWSSNYTDRVGGWGSNYAYDKVGVWSSNYTDRVGGWGSNYAYDKVGMYSSNYTDRIGERTSNYVLATSNILIGRVIHTSNYVSSYKPATAVTADFANRFTNSVNIAGVPFNGTANINISYNSLDNQLSFGNGLSTSYDNITKITSVTANAAPQEQSDWTQTTTSSASFIKNKPPIPANTFQLNGTNIFYNSGNVGIGTNATPLSLMEIISTNYNGALLTLDAGIVNSTTQMPRSIGRPLLKLGKTSYSTTAGDYYGIGFGISPTLSDFNCAEIGTIITSKTNFETGDIIFSTRPNTNNEIATERMRITSAGNVGIGVTDTATYKLNVNGDINIASGSSFRVGGNVLSTFTPSSANLIGSFSSTQFENVSSAIQIKSTWKPTTAGAADTATTLLNSRDIAGSAFNGSANIDISYTNLLNKPTIPANLWKANGTSAYYNDGNVGIGTSALSSEDNTYLTIPNSVLYARQGASTGGVCNIVFRGGLSGGETGKTHLWLLADSHGTRIRSEHSAGGNSSMMFDTIDTTTAIERMRINSAGNVGIGTTDTATYKLNVNGDINIASGSSFRVGGNVLSTFTPSSANLIGSFSSTQFENVSSAIQIKSTWKPTTAGAADTATTLLNSRDIAGSAFNGSANIDISYTNLLNKPTIPANLWKANGTSAYYNDGNVGIGTSALSSADNTFLTIPNSVLYARQGASTGGVCNIVFRGGLSGEETGKTHLWLLADSHGTRIRSEHSAGGNSSMMFDTIDTTTAIERMRINSLGYVGIGISTINYRLEIANSAIAENLWSTYFAYPGTGFAVTQKQFSDITAKVNGSIWSTSYILSSSDSRIKEDIDDINDDSALNMILAIEPKTYKYIDKLEKGDNKVYGFVAQQIRGVIPEATSIQKAYIPNIMLLANYDNNIITLPAHPTKIIIKKNDKIKCYDKNNTAIFVEVDEVIDELTFLIKKLETAYADNKIFISGTEVDDFHTLDKAYIFTLNVCATQELHRRIEAQNVIIKSQDERIKELEQKVERLLN